MNEELKPCPFCGDIPIQDTKVGSWIRYTIDCHNCGLTMWSLTEEDVIKTWNTRI